MLKFALPTLTFAYGGLILLKDLLDLLFQAVSGQALEKAAVLLAALGGGG